MRCKAFSFVEVLVVIAIIVVVTAISFPIWAAAKKRAKESGTIANLKQTWVSIELYRQDYDGSGKSVGDGHDLGLPNQDGFAVLLSKLNLNWWRVPGRKAYGPIFYPVDPSDLTPGYESFLQIRLQRWRTYNQKYENSSVMIGDFNHTEVCGPFPVSTCLFRGFGMTLDGSLKRRQAAGDIHTCNWWEE